MVRFIKHLLCIYRAYTKYLPGAVEPNHILARTPSKEIEQSLHRDTL